MSGVHVPYRRALQARIARKRQLYAEGEALRSRAIDLRHHGVLGWFVGTVVLTTLNPAMALTDFFRRDAERKLRELDK